MSNAEDQQFCLRWNNFQANITSQFETLRDDEDFVDVTLACEGQRLEAHKVVLSACSPFFKELFKSNPCPHPIIFMRDVEARHIIALLEFMYAGEVNVSQAHLSGFLRTAESLQIRGLTDASKAHKVQPKSTDGQEQSMCNVQQSQSNRSLVNKSNLCTTSTKSLSPQPNIKSLKSEHSTTKQHLNVSSIETTVTDEKSQKSNKNPSPSSSPTPAKRQCKETITENILSENNRLDDKTESEDVPQKSSGNMNINPFATLHQTQFRDVHSELDLEADIVEPKVELPDYASDEEIRAESRMTESILGLDGPDTDQLSNIRGGMDILSGSSSLNIAEMSQESLQGGTRRSPRRGLRRSSMGNFSNGDGASSSWVTLPITALDMSRSSCATNGENQQGSSSASDMLSRFAEWTSTSHEIGIGSSLSDQQLELLSNHRRDNCHHRGRSSGRIVKLGEGIEVCEEQLRGVKWNDYRKLTRGLATILFSPLELATCSVTGQRWSRAGTGQRPVKPALDSAKVQAIISYVATRFPMVEISRIKQVLAYKCKENSTAFKMKAIRYFGDQQPPDNQQKAL